MPKISYKQVNFRPNSLAIIVQANKIIEAYQAQGYKLTLRQLYYQFVSRDLIPNTQKSYSRLGGIINDARLAGLIDWEAIEDRTRNLHRLEMWSGPEAIMHDASRWYLTDKWSNQSTRIEVWIEKEALAGVFQRTCDDLEIPFFACRGYTSQSEMWRAAQRLKGWERNGFETVILHFGDHDPSGIDMTRDITDRLVLFGTETMVIRVALTMDQVNQYNPPPNPAKVTDSRFDSYQQEFGDESWELDALEPQVLDQLVRDHVSQYRDEDVWEQDVEEQESERGRLQEISAHWNEVSRFIDEDL